MKNRIDDVNFCQYLKEQYWSGIFEWRMNIFNVLFPLQYGNDFCLLLLLLNKYCKFTCGVDGGASFWWCSKMIWEISKMG